jgi:tetraacyldisaccharide 4'-kinase
MKQIITFLPSLLFGLITYVRNKLFDWGILPSTSFDKPRVIVIGNLSVGGTGKSPLVTYLVQNWRKKDRLGILSRGYGRKTKGYVEVKVDSMAEEVGDEPLAYKTVFPELTVAVCEKRALGVEQMTEVDVILLDDAFQHRSIKGSVSLVCSTFSQPFYTDSLLPQGRLRESAKGIKRADAVIVTRCPGILTKEQKSNFAQGVLRNSKQEKPIFYTGVRYGKPQGPREHLPTKWSLFAGIADPKPFFMYASSLGQIQEEVIYEDHHRFTEVEILELEQQAKLMSGDEGFLTTHKDYVRLMTQMKDLPNLANHLYYLPMEMYFIDQEEQFWDWLGKI